MRGHLPSLGTMLIVAGLAICWASHVRGEEQWVTYTGTQGPGAGKHIVLVSGDEEYRSEEALPMLGRLLAERHGFRCTVLFAIDPKTGEINPNRNDNIPGLEALASADLLILFTRFRNLPDEQTQHIADYLAAGKPLIGIRTATHAFNLGKERKFHTWSWNYDGEDYPQGFGRQVLGETWVNHHGHHKVEGTRGLIAPGAQEHPILRGIKDGSIWGDTDVYTVRLPLPTTTRPLVLGQVLKGLSFDDPPVEGPKNDPMMPVAWLNEYSSQGMKGTAFCSTLGAATDLVAAGSRRMFVNAVYFLVGLGEQIPAAGTQVDLVGPYYPTRYGNNLFKTGVKPASLK